MVRELASFNFFSPVCRFVISSRHQAHYVICRRRDGGPQLWPTYHFFPGFVLDTETFPKGDGPDPLPRPLPPIIHRESSRPSQKWWTWFCIHDHVLVFQIAPSSTLEKSSGCIWNSSQIWRWNKLIWWNTRKCWFGWNFKSLTPSMSFQRIHYTTLRKKRWLSSVRKGVVYVRRRKLKIDITVSSLGMNHSCPERTH